MTLSFRVHVKLSYRIVSYVNERYSYNTDWKLVLYANYLLFMVVINVTSVTILSLSTTFTSPLAGVRLWVV